MSLCKYCSLIKGRRDGTLYVTWYTLIMELTQDFKEECMMRNITINVVDRCDRRRDTFELQQDHKRNQS